MTDVDRVIERLTLEDYLFRQRVESGRVPVAEVKAHGARVAETIAELDELRPVEARGE